MCGQLKKCWRRSACETVPLPAAQNDSRQAAAGTTIVSFAPVAGSSNSKAARGRPDCEDNNEKMKALFLENIHEAAAAPFARSGYEVKALQGSPDEATLLKAIKDVEVLGIRSK